MRERLEIRTSIGVYLFAALKYKIYRHYDLKAMTQRHVQQLGEEDVPAEETVERDLSFEELQQQLEESIQALPDRCRLIFRMSREDEKSADEIAKDLGLSASTVHNQITKAKKLIQEHLRRLTR
jgi:RNA polymerase sigma-70 factor (ECF subfamily)